MGTRADFYIGRGAKAEWLGSVAWDGYPDGFKDRPELFAATTADQFRAAVAAEIDTRDDGTTPSQGWPWPWENGHLTDYSYAFDDGRVWASCFGHQWWDLLKDAPEEEDAGPKVEFPDMTAIKSVTLGKRSGVMIFSSPRQPEGE